MPRRNHPKGKNSSKYYKKTNRAGHCTRRRDLSRSWESKLLEDLKKKQKSKKDD